MKNIIIGIIIGMTLIGVAWAYQMVTLVDAGGKEWGSTSNPIVITS